MKLYTFENENRAKVDAYILSHIEDIYFHRMTLEKMDNDLELPYRGKSASAGPKPILIKYSEFVELEDKRIRIFPAETRLIDGTRGIVFTHDIKTMIKSFMDKKEEELMKEEIIIDFDVEAVEPIRCIQTTKRANPDPESVSPMELIAIYKWFATQGKPFGVNCAFHIPSLHKYLNIYRAYVQMLEHPRYKNIIAAIKNIFEKNSIEIPHLIRSDHVVEDTVALIKWCTETETKFESIDYINDNATLHGNFARALAECKRAYSQTIGALIYKNKDVITKEIEPYRNTIESKGLAVIVNKNGHNVDAKK